MISIHERAEMAAYIDMAEHEPRNRRLLAVRGTQLDAYELARQCPPSMVECTAGGWAVYELGVEP